MKRALILAISLSLLAGPLGARDFMTRPSRKLLGLSRLGERKGRVIVRFRSHQAMDRLQKKVPSALRRKYRRFSMMTTELSGKEAAALARDPDVLSVEPDAVVHLHDFSDYRHLPEKLRRGRFYQTAAGPDDSWGIEPRSEYEPYGLALMGVTEAFHNRGYLGQGVKVGIIDTGIDTGHPDLHVAGGWNFYISSNAYGDVLGHGTHVAGIIAARRNGYGVVGMAPEAELYSLRAFDIFGNGSVSAILDCLQWAIDYKLDVVNMSFGVGQYSPALKDAVDRAYEAGILLVASAGNQGRSDDNVMYPANYDSVIAVSAVDENGKIADFSSRGPAVEAAAPGVDVLSTFTFPPHYEHFYDVLSGTSMAAPHIVGLAALVISANPGITNYEVRRRLSAFALELGAPGRDPLYGWGIPQPERDPASQDQYTPAAAAGISYRGAVGEAVHFSVQGTLDADDNLLAYAWDFGDGTEGAGRHPEHVYMFPGQYAATLTVRDQDGRTGETAAAVFVGAGIDATLTLSARDSGYVRSPDSTYPGRNVIAGRASGKTYYGIMQFDTPGGDDTLILSAELILNCVTGSPKGEGTITAGLLPAEIGDRWPAVTYEEINQATVLPLEPAIVMGYLHSNVYEGAEHRFRIGPEDLALFEEQFAQGRVAFRIGLETGLSSNRVSWTNPRLVVRYLDQISSQDMAPVADAGYDRRVVAGSQVVLDGSGSHDPEGRELTYRWHQVVGEDVTLTISSQNPALATFIAPADDDVLAFELEVEDDSHLSTDRVTVYLNDAPADIHQLVLTPGFGKAGYVEDDHPELNFFDKRVVTSGVLSRWKTKETTTLYGQAHHVGAIQFDLGAVPAGSQVVSALLELTGARRSPDRSTTYDVRILDPAVDNRWLNLNYDSLTEAEAIATLDSFGSNELAEDRMNRIQVPAALLEARRVTTGKVTFRIDGPARLMRNIWEWFIWWSGNEAATAEKGPRLIVEYGAMEAEQVQPPRQNRPPYPEISAERLTGAPDEPYPFTFSAVDADGDLLELVIDWGDETYETVGPVASGTAVVRSHFWAEEGTYTVVLEATDPHGAVSSTQVRMVIQILPPPLPEANHPPAIEVLSAPKAGYVGAEYVVAVSATDAEDQAVRFRFDWGDETFDEAGFIPSGSSVSRVHAWQHPGTYTVAVSVEDTEGAVSSNRFEVQIEAFAGQELVISDQPVGTWYLGSSSSRTRQAQTFKAIGSSITAVSLALVRAGQPAGPIRISIRRSLAASPLASSEVSHAAIESTDEDHPSWVTIHFPSAAEVNKGSYYYLVLDATPPDRRNYYRVGYGMDTYSEGMWYLGTTVRRDLDMACTLTFGS